MTRTSSGRGLFSGMKPIAFFALRGSRARGILRIRADPEVAGMSPQRIRRVVLFPAPLGPRNPTT